MDFAIENLAKVRREIEPLLAKHYEEIALNKDIIKLNKIKNPDKVVAGTALKMPR